MADIARVGREIADALLSYSELEGGLDSEMLEGAWEVGLATPGPAGEAVLREVLQRSGDESDGPLLRRTLESADELPPAMTGRLGTRFATLFLAEPPAAGGLLSRLSEGSALSLIEQAEGTLKKRFGELAADRGETEDDEAFARRHTEAEEILSSAGVALDASAPGETPVAEALAAMFLRAFGMRGRDVVQERLPRLLPVQTDVLTRVSLETAARRRLSDRLPWLEALQESQAWRIRNGRGLVDVAKKLWSEVGSDTADPSEVAAIAAELERLRSHREWPETLVLADVMPDPSALSVEEFQNKLLQIQPLAAIDLVPTEEIAAAKMSAAVAEMRRPHSPAGDYTAAVEFIRETLNEVAPAASAEALGDAWDALEHETWLPGADKHRLHIFLSSIARDKGVEAVEPLSAVAIVSFINEDGVAIAAEVAQWIRDDPGDDAIWDVLRAYEPVTPVEILTAVGVVADEASEERRLELARPALGLPILDERLLDALRFHGADQDAAAALLIDRYKSATNNRDRERVLLLWRALRPSEDEPRKRLIKQVMLPMATLNGEALDLILRELELARQPPRGTKGAVRNALREGGRKFDRKGQVRRRLEDLGWSRRVGTIKRRDEDVNEPGD
jgi:hypothetical protein